MSDSADRSRTRRALVAILAVSFNLRIAVVAVGPLLSQIRATTGMSAPLAGALGAIPFLCMGVFALVGLSLVRRLGERRLVFGSLLLIVVGTLTRAAMPTAALIVIATVPIGIGIAMIGLSLPPVIKRSFAVRLGAATGAYTAALACGATFAALATVPLSQALGGWRAAFAISVVPTVIALPLWLLLPRIEHPNLRLRTQAGRLRHPGRSGVLLALLFGLQSMCYAGMINWLATLLQHNGWSATYAGVGTAAVSLVMIPAALTVPALSDGRDRAAWLLGTALVMAVGMTGLAVLPTSAPWLWIVMFSAGSGALFPLVLTLPLDLAGSGDAVAELTSSMLGYGYLLSASGPLLVGALYGLTGGFLVPIVLLAMLGTSAGIVALASEIRPSLRRIAPTLPVG